MIPEDVFLLIFSVLFLFALPLAIIGMVMDHKKKMAKLGSKLKDSEKENMQNEMDAMKKRLEVLEAIVTDKKYQLSEQISSLKVVEK